MMGKRQMFLPVATGPRKGPLISLPDQVVEFLKCFGGLRAGPPYRTGHFASARSLVPAAAHYDLKRSPAFSVWAEAPLLFYATNGDTVVINPDHSLNWLR